ncbi:tyrosine-type recombinase/integrase [Rhodovulum sp. DZ06]|uniref:tyrosine-type recombinase/integrase n=1 Tax=Rhodovulum sp. DZ06 TaxID=3425126 RepID=UPI003D32CDE4
MARTTLRMKRLKSQRKRGRWFHYFRWPNGKETALIHGVEPDDPQLIAAWAACNAECDRTRRPEDAPKRGSVKMGLLAYMESAEFGQLAEATRKARRAVLMRIMRAQGDRPLATVAKADIEAAMIGKSAHAARADYRALRGAFKHLLRIGMVEADPTEGVKLPAPPRSDGFAPWTAEDIEAFRARWPHGTSQRLIFDVALYTGQRRTDLCRLGWGHVRAGTLEVKQSKTGAMAYVPMTAELEAALAGTEGRAVWLLTEYGRPHRPAGLGNKFRDAASAAGVEKSLHGLRKAFCIYWAEQGRSVHEIAAMSGHKQLGEIEVYTRAADRRRMVQALRSMRGL